MTPVQEVFCCLWSECGFESGVSQEMVRHINYHSVHTKLKCHGYNLITAQVGRPKEYGAENSLREFGWVPIKETFLAALDLYRPFCKVFVFDKQHYHDICTPSTM